MKALALALTALLAAHVHGAWIHDSSYDDFEGVTSVTASVAAESGEPYGAALFTFRCTDKGARGVPRFDAHFTFGYLNRAGAKTAPLRVKFGDEPPHEWDVSGLSKGGRSLFMQIGDRQIERLAAAESFRVRLAYYQEVGATTIVFPMAGARESIDRVLESECGKNAMSARDTSREYAMLETAHMSSSIRCVRHVPLPHNRHLMTAADKQAWKDCMMAEGVEPCGRMVCDLLARKFIDNGRACEAECADAQARAGR